MDKAKIQLFSDTVRDKLLQETKNRAAYFGIMPDNICEIEKEYADSIIISGRPHSIKIKKQREALIKQIQQKGYDYVIEEITYTWFNRFVALKFMEENGYLSVRVFSSKDKGKTEPDVITDALKLDFLELDRNTILKFKSEGNDEELYRYLILRLCNYLHGIMPFLFEEIEDYTELLFPKGLLHTDSVIGDVGDLIPTEDWREVEIVGWIYQYYVSQRKARVFAELKNNKKIAKEDIPAATQLFTPKWIVDCMVENSLGRLWLESNSDKEWRTHFKYFIEQNDKGLTDCVTAPEDIKVLDPAMGSGHILVYAFEVLYNIYRAQGYMESEIAKKILNENLYGLEIDDRATQLAGFAVVMKAREYDTDLFGRQINLNLVAIQETPKECPLNKKLYPALNNLWTFFNDAKIFGSLLNVSCLNLKTIDEEYASFIKTDSLSLYFDGKLIAALIKQAKIMSAKYDVVITNPPYMGYKGMNSTLSKFIKTNYPISKKDLYATFIERCLDYTKRDGFTSMITMHSWMFLSSYEKLRKRIISDYSFNWMVHLGAGGFEDLRAFNVLTTMFCIKNVKLDEHMECPFIRLTESHDPHVKQEQYFDKDNLFLCSQDVFYMIPRTPIVYWVNERIRDIFSNNIKLSKKYKPKQGMATTDNNKFLRLWYETNFGKIGFGHDSALSAQNSDFKWFPYHKGGENKKWYGNNEFIVSYQNDGAEIKSDVKNKYRNTSYAKGFTDDKWDKLIEVWVLKNQNYYFKEGITWSLFGFRAFGVRYKESGYIFDVSAASLFPEKSNQKYVLGFLASSVAFNLLSTIAPTVNFQVGDVGALPLIITSDDKIKQRIDLLVQQNIDISKEEWNSREISWNYVLNETIKYKNNSSDIKVAHVNYCNYWKEKFFTLHSNEEEINKFFISIYGLQNDLTPDVPLEDITILKDETEIVGRNLSFKNNKIIEQFISHSVGCMLGRYSIDKPGLILANQGETLKDFLEKVPKSKFQPDEDNIIPILDDEYFPDDIVGRFKKFLKITFGEEHFAENMDFIAESIGGSGSKSSEEIIRNYFLKSFYKEHCQMYKGRPIYWLFSSGKERAFNALIYMHRYDKELLARMRTDYLHELQGKIESRLNALENPDAKEQKKADKLKSKLRKQLDEIVAYDEKLKHMSEKYIEIDLDDGVKVNYQKFDGLVEKI